MAAPPFQPWNFCSKGNLAQRLPLHVPTMKVMGDRVSHDERRTISRVAKAVLDA